MVYEKEKKTAVALEYTPGEQAPKVIASGRGYLADNHRCGKRGKCADS